MSPASRTERSNGSGRLKPCPRCIGAGSTTGLGRAMATDRLFLSFWHICLDNLPEGTFIRRQIASADAKQQIEQARREGRLLCLSEDDLVAPYAEHERENHAALCRVLQHDFDIELSLEDFVPKRSHGNDSYYAILP